MQVYIYAWGAGPGAMPIAQGTLNGPMANGWNVNIPGGAAFVAGNNYVLAVGAQLQINHARQNGWPNNVQYVGVNGTIYTFV